MAKKRKRPRKAQREETQARLLEDFAKLSGISLGSLLASEFEEAASFEVRELSEEDTVEDDFDLSNDFSADSGKFLDKLADDISVDLDSNKDSDGSLEPEDYAKARRRLKRKVGSKKYRRMRRKEKKLYRARQKQQRISRG